MCDQTLTHRWIRFEQQKLFKTIHQALMSPEPIPRVYALSFYVHCIITTSNIYIILRRRRLFRPEPWGGFGVNAASCAISVHNLP